MIEPTTVPHSAANGSHATIVRDISYSNFMPGTTNPRLAGVITSITSATVSTAINRQCAGVSGASSGAEKVTCRSAAAAADGLRGSRP